MTVSRNAWVVSRSARVVSCNALTVGRNARVVSRNVLTVSRHGCDSESERAGGDLACIILTAGSVIARQGRMDA